MKKITLHTLICVLTFWAFEMDALILGSNDHIYLTYSSFVYFKHEEHSLISESLSSLQTK
jgi:hypothetical protein